MLHRFIITCVILSENTNKIKQYYTILGRLPLVLFFVCLERVCGADWSCFEGKKWFHIWCFNIHVFRYWTYFTVTEMFGLILG